MKYQINHRADPGYDQYSPGVVAAAETVLNYRNAPAGSLSVVLTSSEYIQDLNNTYRGNPEPTDVLSFPDGDKDPETKTIYFGDVIIAVPEAQKQAEHSGHSVPAELNLLVVHGVLHLLGFKHSDDNERKEMWLHQSEILRQLNNEILEPTESADMDPQETLYPHEAETLQNAGSPQDPVETNTLNTNDAVKLEEIMVPDEAEVPQDAEDPHKANDTKALETIDPVGQEETVELDETSVSEETLDSENHNE